MSPVGVSEACLLVWEQEDLSEGVKNTCGLVKTAGGGQLSEQLRTHPLVEREETVNYSNSSGQCGHSSRQARSNGLV